MNSFSQFSISDTIKWTYPAHGRGREKSGSRLPRCSECRPLPAGPAVVARPSRGRDVGAAAPVAAGGNPHPEHLRATVLAVNQEEGTLPFPKTTIVKKVEEVGGA